MVKGYRKHTKPITPSLVKTTSMKRAAAVAKQSAKKHRKQALKYHNTDLRAALDSQTQEIFAITTTKNPSPQPLELSEDAVHALERTLRDL